MVDFFVSYKKHKMHAYVYMFKLEFCLVLARNAFHTLVISMSNYVPQLLLASVDAGCAFLCCDPGYLAISLLNYVSP